MSDLFIAPWNLLQFALISMYPVFISFIYVPNGMSILAVYVYLMLLATPALFLQLKLGGHGQCGIVALFSKHFPVWKGVGIAILINVLFHCICFGTILTHIGAYAFISISQSPYPWGTCDNKWNTIHCYYRTPRLSADSKNFGRSPELEFFRDAYLGLSESIEEIGGFPRWEFSVVLKDADFSVMPIALALVWTLVYIVVAFGGRACGVVLSLLTPLALGCLLAVLGYGYANLHRDTTQSYLDLSVFNIDFNKLDKNQHIDRLLEWLHGFQVVMTALPVWSAIAPTMGKFTGQGQCTRNTTWLLMMLVFTMMCLIPTIAMAPYLGNVPHENITPISVCRTGLGNIVCRMAHAFVELEIPQAYTFLFFLSVFLFGFTFLCVCMLAVIDNIMDSLNPWIEEKSCSKTAVNLLVAFVIISVCCLLSIPHTTKAGMYFLLLVDRSVIRLRFLEITLLAVGLIVVYVKQNFAMAERIVMSIWCGASAIVCIGTWLYTFITSKGLTLQVDGDLEGFTYSDNWVIVSWLISLTPFTMVIYGALHTFITAKGSFSKRIASCCCGKKEDVYAHQNSTYGYQRADVEPTAPPYSYMENAYPMEEVVPYKPQYEPELEPLNLHGRMSQV